MVLDLDLNKFPPRVLRRIEGLLTRLSPDARLNIKFEASDFSAPEATNHPQEIKVVAEGGEDVLEDIDVLLKDEIVSDSFPQETNGASEHNGNQHSPNSDSRANNNDNHTIAPPVSRAEKSPADAPAPDSALGGESEPEPEPHVEEAAWIETKMRIEKMKQKEQERLDLEEADRREEQEREAARKREAAAEAERVAREEAERKKAKDEELRRFMMEQRDQTVSATNVQIDLLGHRPVHVRDERK